MPSTLPLARHYYETRREVLAAGGEHVTTSSTKACGRSSAPSWTRSSTTKGWPRQPGSAWSGRIRPPAPPSGFINVSPVCAALCITTVTPFRQVQRQLWPHIRKVVRRAGLPGSCDTVQHQMPNPYGNDFVAAYGFSAPANDEAGDTQADGQAGEHDPLNKPRARFLQVTIQPLSCGKFPPPPRASAPKRIPYLPANTPAQDQS
ncbi:hypothetical protein [Streptomyces sp. NPDC058308]|uniref:hypothetical protein n=1 Tax=Streptomyces sp. NPDC058308 TaxID=3346440 RepID=UPI0036EE2E80